MASPQSKILIIAVAVVFLSTSAVVAWKAVSSVPAPAARAVSRQAAAQPLLPTGTLSGMLVDAAGHPVAGARVVLQDYDDSLHRVGPADEATSDSSGRFRIGPLAPDYRHRYDLEIDANGFAHQYVPGGTYSIYPGADSDLGRIQMDKGRVFTGQVLDWDGKPVKDAEVDYRVLRLRDGHGIDDVAPLRKLRTDAAGWFHTPPSPVGLLDLEIRCPERQWAGWGWEPIPPGGLENLKPLHLKTDVPIAGTLRDETGIPIADAIITANNVPDTRSNNAGRFIIHGYGPSPQFQMHVMKPGFVMINWAVERKAEGFRYMTVGPDSHSYNMGPVPQLGIVMQRVAWIEGRAIDAQTGEPVRLKRVVLCHFYRQPGGGILLSDCRDPEFQQPRAGAFRIGYTSPSEYHLTFSADGYNDAEAFTRPVTRLQPIEGLVVKMTRQAGAHKAEVRMQRFVGNVTRNGKPVKTGWVGLWTLRNPQNIVSVPMMRGRTVERERIVMRRAPIRDGAYALDVSNPGDDWYVVAEEPGHALTQIGPVAIAPGQTKPLDIACTEGGSISGQVDGIPAAWKGFIWVIAFNKTGVRAEARIDPDGHFKLDQLPPGEYGLKAGDDAFKDSEVPVHLTLKDWKTPAQPWTRAKVVNVESGAETAGVRFALPSN